jgi:hypothetical protein
MGKVRSVPRPLRSLIVVAALTITSCFAFTQNTPACTGPTAEISHLTRPTGVLRADPNANDTASQKIATDIEQACPNLSTPSALRQVRMKISDNNIILTGAVPTEADAEQLVTIVTANADGRTVFNRLEVVPLQMASRGRQ